MFIKCCGFQDKGAIETAVLNNVDAIGFITYSKVNDMYLLKK